MKNFNIPGNLPNYVVNQKIDKLVGTPLHIALNQLDADEGKKPPEQRDWKQVRKNKWLLVEQEQDPDLQYSGAIWITYQ